MDRRRALGAVVAVVGLLGSAARGDAEVVSFVAQPRNLVGSWENQVVALAFAPGGRILEAVLSARAGSETAAGQLQLFDVAERRRLARSGGHVEQYKQPCLMPDLGAIDTFRFCDPVAGSRAE